MSCTGRSSGARRRSARGPWRWRWCIAVSPRRAVLEPAALEVSAGHLDSDFSELASDERIASAAAALERNGVRAVVVATGGGARGLVRAPLVGGGGGFHNTSRTLETSGGA